MTQIVLDYSRWCEVTSNWPASAAQAFMRLAVHEASSGPAGATFDQLAQIAGMSRSAFHRAWQGHIRARMVLSEDGKSYRVSDLAKLIVPAPSSFPDSGKFPESGKNPNIGKKPESGAAAPVAAQPASKSDSFGSSRVGDFARSFPAATRPAWLAWCDQWAAKNGRPVPEFLLLKWYNELMGAGAEHVEPILVLSMEVGTGQLCRSRYFSQQAVARRINGNDRPQPVYESLNGGGNG